MPSSVVSLLMACSANAFPMITFSLGFMTQQAHAAQEAPALRAQARASSGTTLKSELEGRKLSHVRIEDQLFNQWYKSICYVNESDSEPKDYTNLGLMTRCSCQAEAKERNAAGVEWEADDGDIWWLEGECRLFDAGKSVRDCSSLLTDETDHCDTWSDSDWGVYCMVMDWTKHVPAGSTYAFMGCYKDNTDGVPGLSKDKGTKKTAWKCEKACRRGNFKYMGRQGANRCFCGNKLPTQGTANTCRCDNEQDQGGDVNCVYQLSY